MIEINRMPGWAWFFAAVCLLLVAFTASPLIAIQGMVSVMGAGACLVVAQDMSKPAHLRLALCFSITLVSGMVYGALFICIMALS
jgi:hypothetical protein